MKNKFLHRAAILLLSGIGGWSSLSAQQDPGRVLVCTSTFGDYMGAAPITKCTAQRRYIYDGNLTAVARIETGTELSGNDQVTQHYFAYRYNEAGLLTSIDAYQYGLYDFGDRTMQVSANSVTYTYNDKGQCIEESEGTNAIRYEYDEAGNKVKEITIRNGKAGKTVVYSDFVNGLPTKAVSSHVEEMLTGEFYEEEITYDEKGRKVKTYRFCNVDKTINMGYYKQELVSGTFMQEEHWTYNGNVLMLYEKFTSKDEETDELIPYLKTVYTIKDAQTIGHQSYTAMWMGPGNTEWYKSGTYQEDTYVNFTGRTQASVPQLVSVKPATTGINCIDVEFQQPAIASSASNIRYNIYRNGCLIKEVTKDELKLNAAGNLVYTDPELTNGHYEYFIQTVVDETPLCASQILDATVQIDLPAVSCIYVSAWTKDSNNDDVATIHFKGVADKPELGFVDHNLMVGNAQVPDKVFDTNATTETKVVVANTFTSQTIYIMTRYRYGKAISEKLTLIPGVVMEKPEGFDDPDQPGTEEPETPDTPDNPENPDTPENPENPDTPEEPENPDTPEAQKPIVLIGPADYHVLTLSPNGKWATGYYMDYSQLSHGFRWNLESNEIELLSTTEESVGWTIADDGTVGGSFTDHTISEDPTLGIVEPGYYRDGQWHSVEKPKGFTANNQDNDKGQGYAISADGRTLTGSISINGNFSPAVWVDGKLTHLLDISNTGGSQDGAPYCISPDGNIVGGWSYRYNRSCALWYLKSDGTTDRQFISDFQSPWSSVDRFSPDGKKALYGGEWDASIPIENDIQYCYRIYDLETGEKTSLPTMKNDSELLLFGISNSYTCVGSDRSYDYGRGIIYPNGKGPGQYIDDYMAARGLDLGEYDFYVDPETGVRKIFRGQDISADDNTFVLVGYMGQQFPDMRSVIVMFNHDEKHAAPLSVQASQLAGIPTVAVKWAKPALAAEGITGFRINRDGAELTVVDTDCTVYYDRNLANGTYQYTIATVYADGTVMESAEVAATVAPQTIAMPTNLTARQKGMYSLAAEWQAPGTNLINKTWYNPEKANLQGFGIGLDDSRIELGIGFKQDEMKNYEGCTIQKVNFYPMSEQQDWKLNIYQYEGETPVCIYSQPVTQQLNYKELNTVILDQPVAVPTEGDMIVAFEVYVEHGTQNVMGMDYGHYTAGYSDLLRFTDEDDFYSYYYMRAEQGYPDFATFMIDVVLAAPGMDLSADEVKGYKLSLDGEELDTVTTTSYNSGKVADGAHLFSVQAVYADGRVSNAVSTDLSIKYALVGVQNVEIATDRTVATATWDIPVDQESVAITYAAGGSALEGPHGPAENNYGLMAGVEFDSRKLHGYNGYLITSLSFMPTADATFTFFIYEDGELLDEIPVYDYTLNVWNTVELEKPITISDRNTYLLALDCYDVVPGQSPLAIDRRLPLTYVSDLYSTDGLSWSSLTLDTGLSGNWMLRMTLSEPDPDYALIDGYEVRFDGQKVNTEMVTDLTYSHDFGAKAIGQHNVRVNAFYTGRKTAVTGKLITFTIDASSITQPLAETYRICRGTDQILVEGQGVGGLMLVASDGRIVARSAGNTVSIDAVPAGVHVLRATVNGRAISAKVVIE